MIAAVLTGIGAAINPAIADDHRDCLWTHPANVNPCEGLRRTIDANAAISAPAAVRWYGGGSALAATYYYQDGCYGYCAPYLPNYPKPCVWRNVWNGHAWVCGRV